MVTSSGGKPYSLQGVLLNLGQRMYAHRWSYKAIYSLDRWLPSLLAGYRTRLIEGSFFDDAFFLEGAEGGGGDVHLYLLAVDDKGFLLDVGFENFAGLVLRKRHVVTIHLALAGYFTNSHFISP